MVTALKHQSEKGTMSVVAPYQDENQNHVRNQNENKFLIGGVTQQCSSCPEPTSEGEGQKAWLSCETLPAHNPTVRVGGRGSVQDPCLASILSITHTQKKENPNVWVSVPASF